MTGDAAEPTSYVVFSGPGIRWAIPALRVREIVSESEWQAGTPIDMPSGRGSNSEAGGEVAARVLSIPTEGGVLGIRARGIAYRTIDGAEVHALPTFFTRSKEAAFISAVVFSDVEPPLIVINPEGLHPSS